MTRIYTTREALKAYPADAGWLLEVVANYKGRDVAERVATTNHIIVQDEDDRSYIVLEPTRKADTDGP